MNSRDPGQMFQSFPCFFLKACKATVYNDSMIKILVLEDDARVRERPALNLGALILT